MRLSVIAVVFVAVLKTMCFGQSSTGKAKTDGDCSPATSGNNNIIIMGNCSPAKTSRERAHLTIEQITVDVESSGGKYPIWINVVAHISGANRSQTPTAKNPSVLASVVIARAARSLDEEIALFNGPGWANEQYMKFNDVLYPQEPFSFTKKANVTLSIDSSDPFREPERMLRDGELLVYVFIKTRYRDRYGSIPEQKGCKAFKYDPMTETFKTPGMCEMYIAALLGGKS
jgi:hypothetical protein